MRHCAFKVKTGNQFYLSHRKYNFVYMIVHKLAYDFRGTVPL